MAHPKRRDQWHQPKKKAGNSRRAKTPEALSKGKLIANCGGMGLDWERLSLSGYFEALEAHNEAAGGDGKTKGVQDVDRLRRFMDAHRGG